MQRQRRTTTTTRAAFSLAEVMIAIGILGIGLIMVAATFPVGLDQSRVVADETMKGAVADEAFASLQMLLDDPSPERRVSYEKIVNDELVIIKDMPVTVRQALLDSLKYGDAGEAAAIAPLDLIPGNLSNMLQFRTVLTTPEWEKRNLNDWLGSPDKLLGSEGEILGPRLRKYPSLPGEVDELPMFVWSALFRKPNPSLGQSVQFVVFVSRRSATLPMNVKYNPKSAAIPMGVLIDPNGSTTLTSSMFSAGSYVVASNSGRVYRVKHILNPDGPEDPNSNVVRQVVLDGELQSSSGFWFIPVDPATGRSPCIGVFSRTLSLD